MSSRKLLVSVVFLAFAVSANSQPPAVGPVVPPPPVDRSSSSPAPYVPPVPPPLPTSVEQLLDELERIQTQKAALEKQEQALKAAIQKKLETQAERLKKLGVAPAPREAKVPDRVGRIIIEGNTKTPDKKILEKLDVQPGQVLNYPALETSREKLEKAGFRGATVEALPNELDTAIKDVRVKVDESKPKPIPDLQPPDLGPARG